MRQMERQLSKAPRGERRHPNEGQQALPSWFPHVNGQRGSSTGWQLTLQR